MGLAKGPDGRNKALGLMQEARNEGGRWDGDELGLCQFGLDLALQYYY